MMPMRAINPTMPPTTPPIMAGVLVLLVLLDPVPFETGVGVDTLSDVTTVTTPLRSVDVKVRVEVTGGRKLGFEDDDDDGVGVGVGVLGSSGGSVVVMVTVGFSGGLSLHDVPYRVSIGILVVRGTGMVMRDVWGIKLVTGN